MSLLSDQRRIELLEHLADKKDGVHSAAEDRTRNDIARRIAYVLNRAIEPDADAETIVAGQNMAALMASGCDPGSNLAPLLRAVLERQVIEVPV